MSVRHWFLAHLPAGLVAQPAEWFLAVLCFLSGGLIVAGLSHPQATEALLWPPVYRVWGGALFLGSIALIAGLTSIRWVPATDIYTVRRVPAYRLGLRLLGLSSTAYGVAICIVGHLNGALAAALTFAFAAICFIRLLTLGRGT